MTPAPQVTRRTTLGVAAWSAPVVMVAAAAPAHAASDATVLQRTTPPTPAFSEDTATSRTVAATLLNGTTPVAARAVTFTLSATGWLTFSGGASSATATTDSAGVASATLTTATGASPTPGDQVTLTATYQDLTVVWTITYRPFDAVTAGTTAAHVLALAGGRAYAWGTGGDGQLGNNAIANSSVPVAVDVTGVLAGKTITAVSAGTSHSLARASDGTAYAWGNGANGRLGTGSNTSSQVPVAVTAVAGRTITAVAAGGSHSLALTDNGTVYAWGTGGSGQLGNAAFADSNTPVAVTTTGVLAGKIIVAIAAGNLHSMALDSDGVVYTWGFNSEGQLGNNSRSTSASPVRVQTAGTPIATKVIRSIAAGSSHSLAVSSDGIAFVWGAGGSGRLGTGNTSDQLAPTTVSTSGVMGGKTITALAGGGGHSVALASDGTVFTWGLNGAGQLGNGSFSPSNFPVVLNTSGTGPVATITTTSGNSVVLSQGRLAYACGSAGNGLLGNGTTTPDRNVAVKVIVVP